MLTPSEQFFYDHAGYSFDPRTETKESGRVRCAQALAAAEQRYLDAHRDSGVRIVWETDEQSWSDWRVDSRSGDTDSEPDTIEQACILDASGLCLASLGGIEDADDDYRRVIRAELALEAFPL